MPIKRCKALASVGVSISTMAVILSGSGLIPLSKMKTPMYLTLLALHQISKSDLINFHTVNSARYRAESD
jgi:hypothetical protein